MILLRALAVVAVIALLAVGWLALNSEQNAPPAPAAAPISVQTPGYSAQDAVLIETGDDGKPMYTLRAADIRQQPASQIAVLDQVQMRFRDAAGGVWTGRADQGRVIDGASRVDLSGMVTITGPLPGSSEPARISSDRLSIDTRDEVVTTHDPVKLAWGEQHLSARGLIAHLRKQRIRLEADVHGSFSP
ncbi:MAG: LPS export ABC transporter periplasmic protein LptC [Steroidobacteraceae bacterium]